MVNVSSQSSLEVYNSVWDCSSRCEGSQRNGNQKVNLQIDRLWGGLPFQDL